MGVTGLLPVLKSIQDATTLERYRGKTLAIDTYSWLHKAVFCCAEEIVLEKPTKKFLSYFTKKLDMLNYFNITPYFVFDGDYLPSKGNTEVERRERREEFKKMAIDAKKNGNSKLSMKYFQSACDIPPELAKSVINLLKMKYIKFVVAPYEADSQMVFLEKIGLVDGIISEDSDLLVFGCKTLITKLNDRGECIEIKRNNFQNCKNSYINSFDDDQILLMACVSGCDYTKGIPGVGIQTAITATQHFKTFERVLMNFRIDGKTIPKNFEDEYKRAKIAFRHQIVFNPIEQRVQHLNPLTQIVLNTFSTDYILSSTGIILEDIETQQNISNGNLNPFTKKPLISWEAKLNPSMSRSITLPNPKINSNFNSSIILKRNKSDIAEFNKPLLTPTFKKNSTMKIDQFSQFIKSKQDKINDSYKRNQNSSSSIAKRQKLLNKNENGQNTISQFFSSNRTNNINSSNSNNNNNNTENINDKNDINITEFYATSSDTEDITPDNIVDVNMNLDKTIKIQDINYENNSNKSNNNSNDISSDIELTESEDDSIKNDTKQNILTSGNSDSEDIINTSDISQSTITMDKTINHNTPTSIYVDGSSMSSVISNDPGEVNTECYIEEEEEVGNISYIEEDIIEDDEKAQQRNDMPVIDKSNILAEIYSFKNTENNNSSKVNRNKSLKSNVLFNVLNKERKELNSTYSPAEGSILSLNKKTNNVITQNQVHRPSPLNNRIPLQDVTAKVNVNSRLNSSKHSNSLIMKKLNNQNSKSNKIPANKVKEDCGKPESPRESMFDKLSSFRYVENQNK